MSRITLILIIVLLTNFVSAENPDDAAQSMASFCDNYPRAEYSKLKRIAHDDNWFEVYQISDGVTAIYEPHQWQEVISYLIEGEDSALLFDTGNGIGDIKSVVDSLTTKPVMVLNSHSHFDHVGGNYAFDNVLGMDTEFTHSRKAGRVNSEIALEVSPQALCRPLPDGVSQDNHIGRAYDFSQTINDGHKIELGNRTLEVIQVSGHTPDAIALIDRAGGLMWTGDTFYAGPIWLYAPETNMAEYRKSLERMIALTKDINWLLPAHNTPWVNANVLPDVLSAFDAMVAGKAEKVSQGEGMVEYRIKDETRFSFLMRDQALPYKAND